MTDSMALEAVDTPEAAHSGNGAVTAETVGVDKIRDLLFGNQMQDYDRISPRPSKKSLLQRRTALTT